MSHVEKGPVSVPGLGKWCVLSHWTGQPIRLSAGYRGDVADGRKHLLPPGQFHTINQPALQNANPTQRRFSQQNLTSVCLPETKRRRLPRASNYSPGPRCHHRSCQLSVSGGLLTSEHSATTPLQVRVIKYYEASCDRGFGQWFKNRKGGCSGVFISTQSTDRAQSQALGFEDKGGPRAWASHPYTTLWGPSLILLPTSIPITASQSNSSSKRSPLVSRSIGTA